MTHDLHRLLSPKSIAIVGGGVTTQNWATEQGADGWGAQAQDAVDLARKLLAVAG